jgi:hypothetical protein
LALVNSKNSSEDFSKGPFAFPPVILILISLGINPLHPAIFPSEMYVEIPLMISIGDSLRISLEILQINLRFYLDSSWDSSV